MRRIPVPGRRVRAAIVALALLLAFGVLLLCSEKVQAGTLEPLPPKAAAWVDRAGIGFWKAIMDESDLWWDCGTVTPFGARVPRARALAEATIRSMHEHGARFSPWGQMAVTFLESRGNPCSVGPNTRKNAAKLKLLPEGKTWVMYTREDIERIIMNPKWVSRGHIADVGLVQDIYPKYARVLDDKGNLRCLGKQSAPCRMPTVDELVSVPGGAAIGVHGMLVRRWHFNTSEPWWYWPWTPRTRYSSNILATVAKMGGSLKEPFPWD